MLIEKPEDRAFLMSAMRAIAAAARTEGIEFQRYWVLEQAAKQMGDTAPPTLREAVSSARHACVQGRLRRVGMECFFSEALTGQPTPSGKIPLGAEAELARIGKASRVVVSQCEKELGLGGERLVRKEGDGQWVHTVACVLSICESKDLEREAKGLLTRDPLLTAEEAVEAVIRSWEGKANASLHPSVRFGMDGERAELSARMQEALRKIPS